MQFNRLALPALIAVALSLALGLSLGLPSTEGLGTDGELPPSPTMALDAEITDGPCADIDATHFAGIGESFQVAVCVSLPGNVDPIAAFNFNLVYDDTVIAAPELTTSPPSLDDNPDANSGGTTFSSPSLGGGWDCTGGVGAFPRGDANPASGPGNGKAYSGGCSSAAGPNQLTAGSGFRALSVVTFDVVATTSASSALSFATVDGASVIGDSLSELGSCNPVVDVAMMCFGAQFIVGPSIRLDADIGDGACTDIDALRTVVLGSPVEVAVCLANNNGPAVPAFEYEVTYNDAIIYAPEVANSGTALDDNPDANAGMTTFSLASLGANWACADGDVFPVGDADGLPQNGSGRARSGRCSSLGPNELVNGALGVTRFDTLAAGTVSLELANVALPIGGCNPPGAVEVGCTDAQITVLPRALAIDTDIVDGACVDVDQSRVVEIGQVFSVGVCYVDAANADLIAAFRYTLGYNSSMIQPIEQPDLGPALDDNPDANAGSTVFTSSAYPSSLGGGWSCHDIGVFPNGTSSGPCASLAGPQTMLEGPLGVVTFQASVLGTSLLNFESESNLVGNSLEQIGGCGAVQIAIDCLSASITVTCVQPDADCDSVLDSADNCPTTSNVGQADTDLALPNGLNVPDNDTTLPGAASDASGDACDPNDDNDAYLDSQEGIYPIPGCAAASAATSPTRMDTDGDHLSDKWECDSGSNPANVNSRFLGFGAEDADGDRVPDLWERRGYDASGASTDSDGDGCHDMVEIASVDGNRTISDPDRLSVTRRVLAVWSYEAVQDYALDMNKNGLVDDADRLFVARAALLPDWLSKSCP
jgi:hypothetical protein